MGRIIIYQFTMPDVVNEIQVARRWGTRTAIEMIARGTVLEHTATEVDDSMVNSDLPGFTCPDFDPVRSLLPERQDTAGGFPSLLSTAQF